MLVRKVAQELLRGLQSEIEGESMFSDEKAVQYSFVNKKLALLLPKLTQYYRNTLSFVSEV